MMQPQTSAPSHSCHFRPAEPGHSLEGRLERFPPKCPPRFCAQNQIKGGKDALPVRRKKTRQFKNLERESGSNKPDRALVPERQGYRQNPVPNLASVGPLLGMYIANDRHGRINQRPLLPNPWTSPMPIPAT